MDEADHRLGTVVGSRVDQSLAFDDQDCQPQIADDGLISITTYDSDTDKEDIDWDDTDQTATEPLGTLEFDLEGQTIAHQGGGIWELSDSSTQTVKPPVISFNEGETLELGVMQLDAVEAGSSEPLAQSDYERASDAAENLNSVMEDPEEHIALKIESEYAEGWERHLEREAENVEAEVTRDDDVVVMTVEGFGQPPLDPHFLIDDDHGLTEQTGSEQIPNNILELGTDFHVNTTLTNYGDEAGEVTATITIWDESGTETRDITSKEAIGPGDSIQTDDQNDWEGGNHVFETKAQGSGGLDVEPGNEYKYQVKTNPGDDSFEERGTFLVEENPPEFTVDEIDIPDEPVTPRESMTVEAKIENTGERDEQFVRLEGFDGNIVDIEEVEFQEDEQKEVEFEWGSVDTLADGDDAEITVGTEADEKSESVEIDPLLEITNVDVGAEPVEEGDSVAVDIDLESIGGETTQDVVIEGFDSSENEEVTVSGSRTVTLGLDAGERTDRVTVRTDDDESEEVVVVERNGPICDSVNYEGNGEESNPYNVSNVDQLQCINEQGLDSHYQLVDDIDAQGTEYWNDRHGFEPIGPEGHNYPNTYWQFPGQINHEPFEGTFDGNGHAIDGLTIDRPNENFVGLFGATSYTQDFHPDTGDSIAPGEGSVVENIRLTNVTVSGNQHVGGLAGQAGGTVLNARSEGYVEGQEQLVGGLIGDGAHADIDNRLVATGTVVGGEINAHGNNQLNHEGVGGLVGRATWNTQVSTAYTQTDVSGDDYVGAIIGTSSYRDSEFEQMYTNGTATAASANGGAIVGTVLSHGDEFKDSIYWDETEETAAYGEAGNWNEYIDMAYVQTDWNGRVTDAMTGLGVTDEDQMGNLHYEDDGGPWVAIPDDYPRFSWELEAEGVFEVEINNVEDVTAGEAATVDATVTSRYQDRDEEDVTQTVTLTDPDGQVVDTKQVTLTSYLEENDETNIELVWQTGLDDSGTDDVTVGTEDREESASITVEPVDDRSGNPDSSPEDIVGDSAVDIDVDAVEVR